GTVVHLAQEEGWQPPKLHTHQKKESRLKATVPDMTQPPPTVASPPPVDPAADLGSVSPCTHVANSKRLLRLYQPTLRYVLGLGWILWTGQFWRPDPTTEGTLATGFVSGLARSIAEEAAHLYAAAAATESQNERKALYALAEARGKWA